MVYRGSKQVENNIRELEMKKTYINKPNSSHYFRIGKALVRIDFDDSGEYTTDNPLWQKAIENSYLFKVGELQIG